MELKKLIPQICQEGHKILFFSQWTKLLDIAEELLHIINISFLRIDGGVNVDERQTIIDTFGTNDIKYKFIYIIVFYYYHQKHVVLVLIV